MMNTFNDAYEYLLTCYVGIRKDNPYQNLIKNIFNRVVLSRNIDIKVDSSIGFTYDEINAHISILKLSEYWFTYEAVLILLDKLGLKNEKPVFTKLKTTFNSFEEAIDYPKNYCNEIIPFGKPSFFDESRFDDEYLISLINQNLEEYTKNFLDQLSEVEKSQLFKYLIYLEKESSGAQEGFLLKASNNLFNNKFEISAKDILSIVYAVRNQYVHNCETFESGLNNFNLKNDFLNANMNFIASFTVILFTELIQRIE